jgi:tetratricopeptide (TPR) repeat protein
LKKSVTIKAAIIGGGAVIIAAIITGIFLLFDTGRKDQTPHIETGGNVHGPISVFQETGPVTINYNLPLTATKEAIQELEKKLKETDEKIELSRKEIELLTSAPKDLDQRTSGIEKLPDGRTKLGHFVTGHPSIVIEEHEAAVKYYQKDDFTNALKHSQNAIKAYEETKKIKYSMSTGGLKPEAVEVIYRLAAISAQRLLKNELAYQYAQKAVEADGSSQNKALLSTTLANLKRFDEAQKYIQEALKTEPQNKEFEKLRKDYQAKLGK